MTVFKSPLLKRRFASAMLMFWVFALGSAWANACLLQDRTTHLDPSFVGTEDSPCLKVCDDTSQSLVKWQSGMQLPDMAILPSFAMAWSESVVALDAQHPARVEHPAHDELPLRTRYSRLTL